MNNQNNGGTKPIEDYGLIGNLVTAALVGRDGSIDWLCLPRFDSPACFAALLGTPENGRWLIAPRQSEEAPCRISRRYLPGTAVLETCFKTESAEAVLIDFMPLTDDEEKVDLVRIVRGVKGCMTFDMELVLRFAYGQVIPWVRRRDYGLSAIAGPDAVELHTAVALHGRDMRTLARFEVHEGEFGAVLAVLSPLAQARRISFPIAPRASRRPPHGGGNGRTTVTPTTTTGRGARRSSARSSRSSS